MKRLQTLQSLIRLGRFHFLAGGVVLHALGVVMAHYDGAILDITAIIWGQIVITATQLMTHYANDYFDLEADRANQTPTAWSGGSRVLVENRLPRRTALIIAMILGGIAFMGNLILSLFIRPGLTTLALLLLAQLLAWFYNAPPVQLQSRGLGELTTVIVVTLLTPLTGYYLQTRSFGLIPLLAVMPLGCFQFAMLLAIELPDAEGDRQAGKCTLVVRLGAPLAARLYGGCLLLAYVVLPLLVSQGLPLIVALVVTASLPLALTQMWRMVRGDWRDPARWDGLAFYSVLLLVGTSLAELAAFVWLTG
jgi:1,4-dihydroxy-2-naphthoate octaprenyltransferase